MGAYCCLCGWKQRLQPEACTLMAVYQKWSNRKYPKIGRHCVRDYSNAFKKLEPLYNVPLPEIDVDDLQDLIDAWPTILPVPGKRCVYCSPNLASMRFHEICYKIRYVPDLGFPGQKSAGTSISSHWNRSKFYKHAVKTKLINIGRMHAFCFA